MCFKVNKFLLASKAAMNAVVFFISTGIENVFVLISLENVDNKWEAKRLLFG